MFIAGVSLLSHDIIISSELNRFAGDYVTGSNSHAISTTTHIDQKLTFCKFEAIERKRRQTINRGCVVCTFNPNYTICGEFIVKMHWKMWLPSYLPGVAPTRLEERRGPLFTTRQKTIGLNRMITKKPILAFIVLVRALLKLFKLELSTACWSREFHLSVTLSAKKYFLRSKRHRCLANLRLWPLVWLLLLT